MKIDDVKVGESYAYERYRGAAAARFDVTEVAPVDVQTYSGYSRGTRKERRAIGVLVADNGNQTPLTVPARELVRTWAEQVVRNDAARLRQIAEDEAEAARALLIDSLEEYLSPADHLLIFGKSDSYDRRRAIQRDTVAVPLGLLARLVRP